MLYSTEGVVLLTGDLNSRTGVRYDYIENAPGRNTTYADLYMNETPELRKSHDKTVNRFGDLLLDLCKASNLCIVNGRLYGDTNGSYTCMTANGESVVDYLLTTFSNFGLLSDFQVLPFNEYSNHSPLTFTIRVNSSCVRETTREWQSFQWNAENKDIFRTRLSENMPDFMNEFSNFTTAPNSQEKVNNMTSNVTNSINATADKLFVKNHKTFANNKFNQASRARKEMAVWYDDECRIKKSVLREKKCPLLSD